jgi:hypothetical protein
METTLKNKMFIDVDTSREQPIMFGKPPEVKPPATREEAAKFILLDIACLAEALSTLIFLAGENKYGDKNELINASIKTLYGALDTPDKTAIETPENNGH